MKNEDKEKILQILDRVNDPEIGISIVKLGMVGKIEETDGIVGIEIKLTVPGCPLIKTLESQVISILANAGYKARIDFSYMSKEELERAKKFITSQRSSIPLTIARYTKRDTKKDISRIIAVYSAKGGVGKSTVVSLLALVAQKLGYKVGIMDCDISGPSIKSLFGIDDFASAHQDRSIEPYEKDGIKMIGLDLLSDARVVVWRGPLVSGAIKQMYDDTIWGKLDLLLLDLPPGTSDAPITVFQSIPTDGIVIVTTPQDLSFITGTKTLFMAEELKVPVLGVIENMSFFICPHCGKETPIGKGGRDYSVKVLARLPFINEFQLKIDEKIISELKPVIEKIMG